jgi:hypothetical protein
LSEKKVEKKIYDIFMRQQKSFANMLCYGSVPGFVFIFAPSVEAMVSVQ